MQMKVKQIYQPTNKEREILHNGTLLFCTSKKNTKKPPVGRKKCTLSENKKLNEKVLFI